ncbi:hypothetical protein P3J6_121434 [Pseudoalteromonas sp. 3J6]|nr:hypothetical protein P3J6_121434 [Pseudoalteromonas sp. 3J6]
MQVLCLKIILSITYSLERKLGSVDLLRLNLQQSVWYLGKAAHMWCGYSP